MPATHAIPIIFIHYGYTEYLKYTLKAAKYHNPQKKIILLGDDDNKVLEQLGITHEYYSNYNYGNVLQEFDQSFQLIAGSDFAKYTTGRPWTIFNFKKWGYLYNYAQEHKIQRLWTFDSDTLILRNLTDLESRYNTLDYQAHNRHHVAQGLINNPDLLNEYIAHVNSLFKDEQFIKQQKAEFEQHPTFGFTLMRGFKSFKDKYRPLTKRLNEDTNGITFDECICIKDGMVTYTKSINGHYLKRLYYHTSGNFYIQKEDSKEFLLLWGINLSWVPLYIFRKIFRINVTKGVVDPALETHPKKEDLTLMSLEPDLMQSLKNLKYRLKNWLH